tara:strand:+ start:6004 stop:6954 length:951 start_codon:yes stop_codon:yes gene_type:complete
MPLVTVIIPAYNHEHFVRECLNSVEKQTYSNLELLIINDGSVDDSNRIIEEWIVVQKRQWVRLKYIQQENQGLTATLNSAIIWAEGKYISPIASDDILCEDKIELLVKVLEDKGASHAVAFGNAMFIDESGRAISKEILDSKGNILDRHTLFLNYYAYGRNLAWSNPAVFGSYCSLLSGNYLPAMSCIINTEAIKSVGGWTAKNTVEDWELWLKLAKNYKFILVDKVVALYRWHDNNTSKTKRERILRDSIWLLEKEREYAMKSKLHRFFFPLYLYNLKRLREVNPREAFVKSLRLLKDWEFYYYCLSKIKQKLIV